MWTGVVGTIVSAGRSGETDPRPAAKLGEQFEARLTFSPPRPVWSPRAYQYAGLTKWFAAAFAPAIRPPLLHHCRRAILARSLYGSARRDREARLKSP